VWISLVLAQRSSKISRATENCGALCVVQIGGVKNLDTAADCRRRRRCKTHGPELALNPLAVSAIRPKTFARVFSADTRASYAKTSRARSNPSASI